MWNLVQVFECYVEENICTTPIYKLGSLTNTKLQSSPGKLARLHRDLRAHECVDSNGGEIKGGGYIRTCGLVNALNPVVGKSTRLHRDLSASVLNPVVGKLIGLHRDLWACECVESGGEEIDKGT